MQDNSRELNGVGSFGEGLRPLHKPVDSVGATEEIFEKSLHQEKDCCETIARLARRAQDLPDEAKHCLNLIVETAKECGFKEVIDILVNLAREEEELRETCEEFVVHICAVSSQ